MFQSRLLRKERMILILIKKNKMIQMTIIRKIKRIKKIFLAFSIVQRKNTRSKREIFLLFLGFTKEETPTKNEGKHKARKGQKKNQKEKDKES